MSALSRPVVAAAGAAVLFAASPAHADCQLAIDPVQDEWTVDYDPFTADAAERTFDVAMTNTGDTACSGILRVDLRGMPFGLSNGENSQRVVYVLAEDRTGADLTPRSGQSLRRGARQAVNVAPGERALMRFTFAALPEEILSSGLHSQDVFLSMEDARGLPLGEQPITLGVQVASAAMMGLKGEFRRSNGIARIDLGELTAGQKPLATSLYVLSTEGYRVTVRSENEGRLRLGASEWYVDYGLAIGSRTMNLATEDSFSIQSRRARADDYPLTVRIGNVAGKRAGDYSDVLTFTVAAI